RRRLEARGRARHWPPAATDQKRRHHLDPPPHALGSPLKHFVLDTNVLIHDPRAMLQFADNEVVIPIFVLEEIDQFKKEASERGRNAREVARVLDRLRADGARLSSEGATLESGGRLRVLS